MSLGLGLVHSIQNVRRSAGLDISDHIELWVKGSVEISQIVEQFREYVLQETLADEIAFEGGQGDTYSEDHELEGERVTISVRKSD